MSWLPFGSLVSSIFDVTVAVFETVVTVSVYLEKAVNTVPGCPVMTVVWVTVMNFVTGVRPFFADTVLRMVCSTVLTISESAPPVFWSSAWYCPAWMVEVLFCLPVGVFVEYMLVAFTWRLGFWVGVCPAFSRLTPSLTSAAVLVIVKTV